MNRYQRILQILGTVQGGMTAVEICVAIGEPTGTLHALLHDMERAEKLCSDWEPGRYPRRRLYRLAGRS